MTETPGSVQSEAPTISWRERHHSTIRQIRVNIRTYRRNGSAMIGLAIVVVFIFTAFFGSNFVPFPDDATGSINLDIKLQPPNSEHLFGTDEVGRDVFTRVVIGASVTLKISVLITFSAMLIGVPLGVAAGYLGGRTGQLIMRTTDVFLSVPALILAIAIVGSFGPGISNAIIALTLAWWPGYVRLVQAKALSIKSAIYVDAARTMGASNLRIIFVHILPNCASPIIVKVSMDMGMSILGVASLGFLGLGAQPPFPEWGAMISSGRNYLPDWWWYSFFPGIAIFLTVLGFNLVGDGLRDVLDPKGKR